MAFTEGLRGQIEGPRRPHAAHLLRRPCGTGRRRGRGHHGGEVPRPFRSRHPDSLAEGWWSVRVPSAQGDHRATRPSSPPPWRLGGRPRWRRGGWAVEAPLYLSVALPPPAPGELGRFNAPPPREGRVRRASLWTRRVGEGNAGACSSPPPTRLASLADLPLSGGRLKLRRLRSRVPAQEKKPRRRRRSQRPPKEAPHHTRRDAALSRHRHRATARQARCQTQLQDQREGHGRGHRRRAGVGRDQLGLLPVHREVLIAGSHARRADHSRSLCAHDLPERQVHTH